MSAVTLDQALQRAVAHHQAGELPQAEALYRQILAVQPNHPDALHLLGLIASQVGRPDAAIDLIRQAISQKATARAYHCNLGDAYRALSRLDEGIACYRRALALSPDYAEALNSLGIALSVTDQQEDAIACYQRAIALRPEYAEAHGNLGTAFSRQGRLDEAAACCRRAVEIKPAYAEAHYNLGVILMAQEQLDQAADCFQRAADLRPDYGEAWNNLGVAFFRAGRFDEAIACFEKRLTLQPENALAYNNLGNVFKDQGRLEEALAAYRQASRLNPNEPRQLSNRLFALHLHPGYDARALLTEHRQWEQRYGRPRRRFHRPHANTPDHQRRLKIGYVSPDLWNNPIGRFLLPLFENHDRANFEILCYSDADRRDSVTTRLQACADNWQETSGYDEEQMAERMRSDGVDILMDLSLHMGNNRLPVFARKPAPVQVTWLAYPSTSGLKTIDYRLTDPYIDPPDSDATCYSETSLRLPDTFWCYSPPDEAPDVTPLPALSAGVVTFGCLNNFCKINPSVLAVWVHLLREVPNARLILHTCQGSHRDQTQAWLAAEGISPERVHFVDMVPMPEYFAHHSQTDIALDPFPWAGGTTTCDALWMGAPVVTLAGQTAVGRGGLSLLSNIGLPELVAHSEDEYVKIAVELANDLPRLAELRATMRARMQSSPLMDGPRFAQGVEAAYRQMWTNWCRGK